MAHMFFCLLTGTRVQRVCLFRIGNPAGYVMHARPATVWRHILVGTGPMLVNTVGGFLLGLLAWQGKWEGEEQCLLAWLGLSVGTNSFPSSGVAKGIWRAGWGRGAPLSTSLIGVRKLPPIAACSVSALLRIFCLRPHSPLTAC